MARKFRTAESYYGNTAGARKRQRANLIPGNPWQKRKTQELRINCFWEIIPFDKKITCEAVKNKKDIKESEKHINNWWGKLDLGDKKRIYKNIMVRLTKELKSNILKDVEECLKRKLALLEKGF